MEEKSPVCRVVGCPEMIDTPAGFCYRHEPKPMEEKKEEWCEHVGGEEHWYKARIMTTWKCCPICASPRPAEKKKLAELLQEKCIWTFKGKDVVSSPHWESVAKLAIQAVNEVIDECKVNQFWVNDDKLKARLKEME